MAIRNVIFDFGQVLCRYCPEEIAAHTLRDSADVALVVPVLFDRLYWDRLDAGTITDEEVIAASCARLPARLHGAVREIYENWYYRCPEIAGMRELVLHLKREYGVKIYVLSNISRTFAAHESEIPILALADGRVYSAVAGFTKPDVRIFGHLCAAYGLDPAECVFVDDSPKNVAGAEKAGICGLLFDGDAANLSAKLDILLQSGQNSL